MPSAMIAEQKIDNTNSVGLGLGDAKDITVRGLEIVKKCNKVLLEAYTSILTVGHEVLEAFYGRPVIIADRELCESNIDDILKEAIHTDVALLVVVHNASIINAVSCCGLQLYNFGETVSIPYWTETWKPSSFFDKIVDITKSTLVVGLSRIGSPDQKIVARSLGEMQNYDLGPPLQSLVIPAPVLHPLELDYIRHYIGLGSGFLKDITVKGLEIVKKCDKEAIHTEVALLVYGDPLDATTHTDMLLRAKKLGVETKIIHNLSIMNRVSCCGLKFFDFGNIVSIPLWTETWKPSSFFYKIVDNFSRNLHSFCVLDITQSTLVVALSHVAADNKKIIARSLGEMQNYNGPTVQSLVIPAPILHPRERAYIRYYSS
ncbi:unnamed protein product [Leptidea sinapis]|uniref:Diphthine methyl ester synthase n=1 Tax=Leptidea sinapis TaxID=189913 RepID=A0A5E4Q2J1_9NEOP|nr:unnamed protein product [Leptidea sinapis]